MNGPQELTYSLGRPPARRNRATGARGELGPEGAATPIPRIARMLALAIGLEQRVRNKEFRDYAEVARLARITRARMTQITKLLDLAPDIQEELLFMPATKGITERNLRPVAAQIAWADQRRLFRSMLDSRRQIPQHEPFGATDLVSAAIGHKQHRRMESELGL